MVDEPLDLRRSFPSGAAGLAGQFDDLFAGEVKQVGLVMGIIDDLDVRYSSRIAAQGLGNDALVFAIY